MAGMEEAIETVAAMEGELYRWRERRSSAESSLRKREIKSAYVLFWKDDDHICS
ncbi:hypothetical protein CRG98_009631 [Punica granatum]|uniref:Uncharacterized protein n=1 Tax=Punica granatum TaxID=22663 RepID=A0A2I0KNI1_PUNGR|nr:hypothetical protein CRG98_009631 [Punica granatum]